jgi:hypothetical protein
MKFTHVERFLLRNDIWPNHITINRTKNERKVKQQFAEKKNPTQTPFRR